MSVKTYLAGMLLPVNPLDEIAFSATVDNKSQDIISLGEVTFLGYRKLAGCTIKSLMTAKRYPFTVDGASISPQSFINQIYAAIDAKKPVRFIVTGIGADINMLCSIESWKHEERHGQIGEYYYEIQLKEYRTYGVKSVQLPGSGSSTRIRASVVTRESEPVALTNYTVVKGDCLSAIAKAQLGDSSRWREIYEANKDMIKNPNLIYPGQSLIMPSR